MVSARMPSRRCGPVRATSRIEQPPIAVNRGEAIPEFVRQSGRQLAQTRQRFLEPQLLFQFDDRRQIREQADGRLQSTISARIGDTVTPRCFGRRRRA